MIRNSVPEYRDPSRFWISIIGMGAGGARLFKEFIDQIELNTFLADQIGFILIDEDPLEQWGRGIAWGSNQSDLFSANMRFDRLSLPQGVEDSIRVKLGIDGPWDHTIIPENIQFVSRRMIGDALHEEFIKHLKTADRLGIPVHNVHQKCNGISRYGKVYVNSTDTEQLCSDFVVLCLGNFPKRLFSEFHGRIDFAHNPWHFESYRDKLKGMRVGIIGLGPTAVDCIVLAGAQGAKEIVAVSRNARMQHPRPKNTPYTLRAMPLGTIQTSIEQRRLAGKSFSLKELMMWLELEFNLEPTGRACEGWNRVLARIKQPDYRKMLTEGIVEAINEEAWYSILKAMDELIPTLWDALSEEGRQEFRETLEVDHACLSYGMALQQAKRVSSLIEDKVLSIGKMRQKDPIIAQDAGFQMHYNSKVSDVDILINCTGIGSSIVDLESSEIVASLIKNNMAAYHRDGGLQVDFNTGQLFMSDRGDSKRDRIFSLAGSLTRGTHLLTNCLGQLASSCERTSNYILKSISGY